MIVDTSALVAILRREDGYGPMLDALIHEPNLIPAPVLVEFARVVAAPGNQPNPQAVALVETLLAARSAALPFSAEAANWAVAANQPHGRGNGRGGQLNILDLMVLGCARSEGRPVLGTGRDFVATVADAHPASRPW